ncbi:MAG: TonB family protein [Bacteroidota bacterium]|jgi:protein TonB|nr:TonB family protein [Bacteroidota bacterium]
MTANWNSVVDDSRNDIVFEGRNQDYGAYQIRRKYNWTVTLILGCMVGALALGMTTKYLLGLKSDDVEKETILDMTTIDLTPPPVDKNEPPPPPPPPPPPVMETVKFVPPVIKDDAVETDPPPPQEKLAETNVSTVTQEGDGDAVVVPTEGNGNGVVEEKAPEIFTVVEEMPEFPGGAMEMMKYIQKNIQYPQMAKEAGLSGKCFLKFVVNGNGNITDVTVLKGVPGCGECDREAIRVVKSMPNWKPGKQNGRAVSVFFNLPINFQLR